MNVLSRVYEELGTSDPKALFPMDGNDQYGDCTIAALAHAVTTYRGLPGVKRIMAKQDVVKLYFHLRGRLRSREAGSLLRFGWARRCSMSRIMASLTMVSETSGSSS